jgi:hypothetical protein
MVTNGIIDKYDVQASGISWELVQDRIQGRLSRRMREEEIIKERQEAKQKARNALAMKRRESARKGVEIKQAKNRVLVDAIKKANRIDRRVPCENCQRPFLIKDIRRGNEVLEPAEGLRVQGKNLCRECACADEVDYREFWFDATISNNETVNPQVRYHFDVAEIIKSKRIENSDRYER